MFSQNVFSAKDVLLNSNLCDTWDSQSNSQLNSYSQNSQLSSMDLFSQQKPTKFDQNQRSQSQTTDEEPSNYYSKYVNNPPLFHGAFHSENNQMKTTDIIEEQKRNISMREERDLLQTFVNLLKDYTKEVNSAFQNFKEYMEKSLEEVTKSVINGAKDFDENFQKLKGELLATIAKTDMESNKKQDSFVKNLLEQTGTNKVLESEIKFLEKQLNEAKDKETSHADLKTKFYQLEQKYLQDLKNWNYGPSSFVGNTPPLSQQPLDPILLAPLRHERSMLDNPDNGNYQLLPNQVPLLATSYGLGFWEPGNPSRDPTRYDYNTHMNAFQMDSKSNPPLYAMPSNVLPNTTTNCLYPSTSSTGDCRETLHVVPRNHTTHALDKQKEFNQTPRNLSYQHGNLQNPGSNVQSGLIVTRRSTKRPRQSPMAMVRPQVRRDDHPNPNNDDDILICAMNEGSTGGNQRRINSQSITKPAISLPDLEWNGCLDKMKINGNEWGTISSKGQKADGRCKPVIAIENGDAKKAFNPIISAERMVLGQEVNKGSKRFRREESVRRKRSLVSMLGTSSDDLEVQEIANSIKAQQRMLVKRIKSLS